VPTVAPSGLTAHSRCSAPRSAESVPDRPAPVHGGDNYIDVAACPFQNPLGALVPVLMRNLLPAAKNIGTTHITNGCFRLHPIEWNIVEAAGSLAAFCLEQGCVP
jgi:hypothetical protein